MYWVLVIWSCCGLYGSANGVAVVPGKYQTLEQCKTAAKEINLNTACIPAPTG